ncbi:hypothetical protein KY360_01145 [Candidatus Woesearchaeota archaeon]|nr:hypothetical protein [Candidatus Woesearchaeota archaeon]
MTTGTKRPALEDIDSPEHRELHRELVLTVGEGTDYGALVSALGDYGKVGSVVKEGTHPFVSVTCLDSSAKRLRADYEAGMEDFKGVTGVHNKLHGSVCIGLNGTDVDYDALLNYLARYGTVMRVERGDEIPLDKDERPFVLLDCSPEAENLLQKSYERNGQTGPMKYVTMIRRVRDDVRLIY